jgi:hypothetical protein
MKEAINYQKCPKCDGEGYVFDPNFMGTVGNKPCPVCNGAMIIPMYLPPSETFTSQERDEFAGFDQWAYGEDWMYDNTRLCWFRNETPENFDPTDYGGDVGKYYQGIEVTRTTSDLITQYKEYLESPNK